MSRTVLAIDVGGTKIAVAVIDDAGRIVEEVRELTVTEGNDAGKAQLESMLRQVTAGLETAPLAVGMAIPAVLEHGSDRVIWAPNLPGWNDLPLKALLNELCRVPAAVEYDGHASALGEGWLGAARGSSDFVTVAIGTGIGCGVVANGDLVRGLSRVAGAAGWFVLGADDQPWEELAAGPAVQRIAQGLIDDGAETTLTGESKPDAKAVFAAARAGDDVGRDILERIATTVGKGVSNLVSVLNPEIIVLGGSVGTQPELLDTVRRVVDTTAQPYAAAAVKIINSPLGSSSVILGAARAALNLLDKQTKVQTEGAS